MQTGLGSMDRVECRPRQAWLSSASWDCLLIIAPSFLSSAIVLLFSRQIEGASSVPLWAWVCFVLMIDVAHVYATLFRTYLHPTAYHKNRTLLLTVPFLCWVLGSFLYALDGTLFWRALAYLAVFHFIRQQYGFIALYSRRDPPPFASFSWLNVAIVYIATVYPLLFWHTHLPRNFNWFIDGDFFTSLPAVAAQLGALCYSAIAICYIAKELFLLFTTRFINIPRNLLILGTAISWWVGIVALNSDLAFTITNVVSHGIPYIGLIWLYHHAESSADRSQQEQNSVSARAAINWHTFLISNVLSFVVFLIVLAYLEEGLWAGLVWREHMSVFQPFSWLPTVVDPSILALLVPLLSLPQSTHYVLDGFIWRVKERTSIWSA